MRIVALVLCCSTLLAVGCDDPMSPKTWIKKLDDPREQKEAVRQLVRLKDPVAVEPLMALFKKTRDPEQLRAIATFHDKRSVQAMADALLDFNEESFDGASIAATALGEIGDPAGVDALIRAASKPLPVKSRANVVRAEAIKSLGKIGDPKAIDTLDHILATPADDQDFYLNKLAAEALAKFHDPRSVPTLIRGLFMTGRGADIFSECRVALISIGEPAVDKLVETLQRKNLEVETDAKKYDFFAGIIEQKASILLGDLHAKKAVPALLASLAAKDEGLAAPPGKGVSSHQSILLALGIIGDPAAEKPILAVLEDAKEKPKLRIAAADALNMMGDPAALPALAKLAKTSFVNKAKKELDPEAAALASAGATDYSRLAGPDGDKDLQKLDADVKEAAPDVVEVFKAADDRIAVAKECKQDVACFEKYLADKTSAKSEKAAFALSRLGKPGLDALLKHVNAGDPPTRMAVLFGIGRLGGNSCPDCTAALDKQIDTDEGKPPLRPLVEEMRATRAMVSHK